MSGVEGRKTLSGFLTNYLEKVEFGLFRLVYKFLVLHINVQTRFHSEFVLFAEGPYS